MNLLLFVLIMQNQKIPICTLLFRKIPFSLETEGIHSFFCFSMKNSIKNRPFPLQNGRFFCVKNDTMLIAYSIDYDLNSRQKKFSFCSSVFFPDFDFSAGDFLSCIACRLTCKIIRTTMNNHRFTDDFAEHKTICQKKFKRIPMVAE